MGEEIVMSKDNLEELLTRIFGCKAVMETINKALPKGVLYSDALYGAIDLLDHIGKDFDADIACAEICAERGAGT